MTGTQSTIDLTAEPISAAVKTQGGWNEERLAEAIRLAADGKKAREIADIIGHGITRSAVICKLRRENVTLLNAPAGGREIDRKGITKGKGYRSAGKAPRSRRRDKSPLGEMIGNIAGDTNQIHVPGSALTRDYDGELPNTALATGYGEVASGSLSLRRSRGLVMVSINQESPEWDPDRIKMARQLIEDKGFGIAEAARQMGVTSGEMRKASVRHNIRERGYDALTVVRGTPTLPGLVAKETPTSLDIAARSSARRLDRSFDAAAEMRPQGEPVSILDLKASDCRWLTDTKDKYGLATYCGCHAVPGTSYCAHHAGIVFTSKRND